MVSASMIMMSRKLTVIHRFSDLNRESTTSSAIMVNDSSADRPGRRMSASQAKLSRPQVSRNNARPTKPTSLHAISASAARWMAATRTTRGAPCWATASANGRRVVSEEIKRGMRATAP